MNYRNCLIRPTVVDTCLVIVLFFFLESATRCEYKAVPNIRNVL